MKEFVPLNSSEIVAYKDWMDNKKVGEYDLNKYCAYGLVISPMLANLTQWLDLPAQNEPGLQSPDSTTTVKKDIHSTRKIVVGLNTKRLALPLADNRKTITFTDKKGIGRLKLKGTRDLHFYSLGQIKR